MTRRRRMSGSRAGGLAAAAVALLALAAAEAPRPLRIDRDRSVLEFTISRPGETIEGRAGEFSGEVLFDRERPDRSAVRLRVRAASLETGNGLRDRKMRKSHLEVESFPEIVFQSTSIRLGGDGKAVPGPRAAPGDARRALVEGTLSLHGVERSILFPVTIRYDTGSLTAEGELDLKLSDHGIPIPRFLWIVLDNAVTVRFHFAASGRRAGDEG
jgi:polyisoprenoid-binding protein YceI